MGGVAKTVKKAVSNPIRAATAVATMGTSELARKMGPIPKALASLPENAANAILGTKYGMDAGGGDGGAGGLGFDSNSAADQAAIRALGQAQYDEMLKGIDTQGKASQEYAAQTFQKMLPGLAEDYNAGHLLNSTGYQSEAARQASSLANDVALQMSQKKLDALSGKHGFDTSALQRGLGLQDFMSQARLAQSLAAQAAPPPPTGKAQFGQVAQGIGALAPMASLFMGPGAGAAMTGAGMVMQPGGLPQRQVTTAMGRPVYQNQTAGRSGK